MKIPGSYLFLAGALAALGAGWVGFPHVIYKSRPQPVDFSHKTHADKAGLKCEDCHAFRDDGTFAGIPPLEKCAGCHASAMGSTAAEKNFIDRYVTPNREPAWADYARQPENVFFSHISHVKLGGLKCEECHGEMGASDTLRVYQEDRIGGYSRDIWGASPPRNMAGAAPGMKMDDCVDCHRRQGLSHSCLDCHK
ncbi:MAG TPA: menaquinone reductase multiheme cytochrome c subunit QrcA [Bryobacteraceae bacterium]|nr:menaquinone reductase multiheme cytochrome c subunit QrcA [Bryobacteraceae bacterium]